MASAQYALSSLLASQANGRTPRRIPLSSKRHRKNYLRPKILKTVTKPYPLPLPLLPSPPPPNPVVIPQENNNLSVEIPSDETLAAVIAGESENLGELQVSVVTAKENGVFDNVSAKDIFKYGAMYFLGFFVLQTIYAVWAVWNYKLSQKDEDLVIDGRRNGDGKTVSLPANVVSEEQLLMERKIEEIRLMAREARRIEWEKKGEDEEEAAAEEEEEDFEIEDDEGAVSSHRVDIEKEIGKRLSNLQNRINRTNARAKEISEALQMNAHEISAAGVDRGVNVNKGDEALVFKKKIKFRSPSTKATKTPKGFPGTRNRKASDAKKRNSAGEETAQDCGSGVSDQAQMLHEDKQVKHQDAATQKSVSSVPLEERPSFVDDEFKVIQNHAKNLKEKTATSNMKTGIGNNTRRTNNGNVFNS
ncbi:unnamed protein product [Sphenostylis stenocarpa]|uniref:Uncharacterized protein n=1 Tax=Sphenostylis stenocarpa TaxID=92480 RepID=A0AA86V882_9FABA|nr:unnamed protein product [Sphenostylis stenocarpa]